MNPVSLGSLKIVMERENVAEQLHPRPVRPSSKMCPQTLNAPCNEAEAGTLKINHQFLQYRKAPFLLPLMHPWPRALH